MPKYSPIQTNLQQPKPASLRLENLSDSDFFRIYVAARHRMPPPRVSRERVGDEKATDSGKRLFPHIDRDRSARMLVDYSKGFTAQDSRLIGVSSDETHEIGDIVTLHNLEAFYADLHFVEKPQGKFASIMNGKMCVSVKCKY